MLWALFASLLLSKYPDFISAEEELPKRVVIIEVNQVFSDVCDPFSLDHGQKGFELIPPGSLGHITGYRPER